MGDQSIGFSLWLDFIERVFLKEQFGKLIQKGIINGATSNPTIFKEAISKSPAYKEQLQQLQSGEPKAHYEALAFKDIKLAAQTLLPLYGEGNDGYVSIEIDPFLANDAKASIEEGKRIFHTIGMPNVMIKVPATDAGYEVMEALLSEGISVNATLIFSPDQAKACLKSMKRGIDRFESSGGRRIEAVISVFVSRFDRKLDELLVSKGLPTAKVGIMNAAKIYNMIELYRVPSVRTLFASTGVKGDHLPADYYIRALYAPHSVNTAPLHTIEKFIKGDKPKRTIHTDEKQIEQFFIRLQDAGIYMNKVYDELLKEGLEAFELAFSALLDHIEEVIGSRDG